MTSDASNLPAFDFDKPGRLPDDEESVLGEWHRNLCVLLAEKLSEHVRFPVSFKVEDFVTSNVGKMLDGLAATQVAYEVFLDQEPIPSMFIVPRPYLLAIANGMLGEELDQEIEDRPFTDVEKALADLAMETLVEAISESYLGSHPLPCRLGSFVDMPKRSRTYQRDAVVIVSTLKATLPSGDQRFIWMIPPPAVEHMPLPGEHSESEAENQIAVSEEMLHRIPIEMSVTLGSMEAHVSQLTNLKVGDVLVLNQRLNDPLIATVDGEPQFQVWPGRIGSRRAIQVVKTAN